MNCEEFRIAYNAWLDGRKSAPLGPDAARHAAACSSCTMYARALSGIDTALRDIPDVPVPEEILAFTVGNEMHSAHAVPGASSLLRAGALLALPPLAVWCISLCIPSPWQSPLQFLLLSGALIRCAVTSLRPRFVG